MGPHRSYERILKMATRFSSTLVSDITTDARFRANAQFVEDTLVTTGGWLLSTETGDTAPGSLAHPTAINTKKGFRVYKTNDGLTQVYMRIDYGSTAAASGNGFGMWITLGTGSDGAGTLSGVFFNGGGSTQATVGASNTTGTTGAVNSYGSADTGRVHLGMFVSTTAANIVVFSLERTKDSTGADTSDGILISARITGSTSIWASVAVSGCIECSVCALVAGGTQPTSEYGLSFILTRNNPSETFGNPVGVGLIQHFKGASVQPGVGLCAVNSSDVSAEGSFTQTIYGATRTYQHINSLSAAVPTSATVATARSSSRVCIRYD